MKTLRYLFGIACLMLLGWSCTPEPGPGGKAEIRGLAAHHSQPIASTRVFIKYGTTTSPGTDPTAYDDSTVAGNDGRFSFFELEKGTYYLYGIGYDTTIGMPVTAGIPVVINEKKAVQEVLLPVTE